MIATKKYKDFFLHNFLKFIFSSLACIARGIGLRKDIFIQAVRRIWCGSHLLPHSYLLPIIPFVPLVDFTPVFMSRKHAWLYVSVENQGSACERKLAVFVCLPQSALINIIWLTVSGYIHLPANGMSSFFRAEKYSIVGSVRRLSG